MIIKIGEKELNVKYGYEATLKSKILSRLAKFQYSIENVSANEQMEKMEEMLLFLPEFLLVGLQRNHDEYKYDLDNETDKDSKLSEMFELIEEYLEEGVGDAYELFTLLQNEMLTNGFLRSMFLSETAKAKQKQKK